ncbi:MAG: hypothetical protein MI975_25165 [Cytophagales bacterium]|nr:hypothetical protein [Cytophagales bacterium]
MKKYFLMLILIIFIRTGINAQSSGDIPPLSFGVQQAAHGVDLSSGVLNISIPLDNSIIPIGLSYSAGGIKVNQISGPYGLGWNLTAESFIVREIRGLPDDEEEGYSGKNKRGLSVNSSLTYSNAKNFFFDGLWDTEPDIFRYRIPGYSGSFIIDPNRNIVKLTHDNLRITANYNDVSGYYSFNAIDPNGNSYLFSKTESMTNQMDSDPAYSYKYKWHLTRINYYNSSKNIIYEYLTSGSISTETTYQYGAPSSGTSGPLTKLTKNIKNSWYPKLLERISFNNRNILFEYENRTDITNGKRLKRITIQENRSDYAKYEFKYDYFTNEGTDRLKLTTIYKVSPSVSSKRILVAYLNYFGDSSGERILPSYNSSKQDHWGFYNNNTSNSLFVYEGANREPSLAESKACTIKKIYFPTGKLEEYDFELNTYFDGSTNKNAGGLRIKSITTKDENNNEYVKSFNYNNGSNSSGQLYNSPHYQRYRIWYEQGLNNLDGYIYNINSYRSLYDFNGRHVIYEKVTTSLPDGSEIENNYKTYNDELAAFSYYPSRYKIKIDRANTTLSGHTSPLTSNNDSPYGSNSFLGILAGYPEKTSYFNNSGKTMKNETYSYQYYHGLSQNYGIASLIHRFYLELDLNPWYAEYYIGKYQIKPYYFKLDSKTVKEYDVNNQSNYSTIVTDYSYDPNNYLVNKTETYQHGETTDHSIQEVDYLVSNPFGLSNVVEHNLLNLVSTVRVKKDDKILSREITSYTNNAQGNIELIANQKYNRDYKLVSHDSFLNEDGTIVQSTDQITWRTNSIIWDDYKTKEIATVSDANIDNVAYSSFEYKSAGSWNLPLLKYDEDCTIEWKECVDNCNGDVPCEDNCEFTYFDCRSFDVNISKLSRTGNYSFDLDNGNITKNGLTSGSFIIGYWYKSGSVSLSGISSNTLLTSYTIDGWNYEERKIQISSPTLTITGSALIDELKLFPDNASMTTKTYNYFGPSSETDINNFSRFVDYDEFGRLATVKDNNMDIVSHYEYNLIPIPELTLSTSSISVPYTSGSTNVSITSNTGWAVSDDASWITVSPTSGNNNGTIIISYTQNTSTAQRSGKVIVSADGAPHQTVTVGQAALAPTLTLTPNYVEMDGDGTFFVTVTSNTDWELVYINYYAGSSSNWIQSSEPNISGTGDALLEFDVVGFSPGNSWEAEIIFQTLDGTLWESVYVTVH